MYLLALTVGLSLSYLILLQLFFAFFKNERAPLPAKSVFSILVIALLSVLSYAVSEIIPDRQLGNRFLHAMGGGFLSYLICFLLVRDSKLVINKFQFFIFSALVVTAMGVANEIIEYILQTYFVETLHFVFSKNINDTWLDLISNTAGIIAAAILFTPFVGRSKKKTSPSRQG